MIKLINCYKRIWRICMIFLCLSKVMVLKMILCLLLRAYSVHHVLKVCKIWSVSELITHHGTTSHSRSLVWECQSKDKDFPKCTPNHSMKDHITEVIIRWDKLTQVLQISTNMVIGNKCSALVKILKWLLIREAWALVSEEWDPWQPRSATKE